MTDFLLSQIFAAIAFTTDFLSFQLKSRRAILSCLFISAICLGIHFIFLQQAAAATLIFVSAARFLIAQFTTSIVVMYLSMIASIVTIAMGTFTWVTGIALLASLIITWSVFRPDDYRLRKGLMLGTSFWILHNTLIKSPVGIIVEVSFLISNLLGYWRFYGKKIKPVK